VTAAPEGAGGSRAFSRGLAALTILGAALRMWGLPSQVLFGDDRQVAWSAVNYLERGRLGPSMWNHPHLSDLLAYASSAVLGQTKLGLAAWSLAFGIASIPLLGLLARRLAGDDRVGLLAALLLAVDSLHIDYSRQAVKEDWMLFFTVAGLLLALCHRDRGGAAPLAVAGAAFGLGLACKWYVAAPFAVALLWLAADGLRQRRAGDPEAAGLPALRLGVPSLVAIATYLATFAPWFAQGRGFADLWTLHRLMAGEQIFHQGFTPFGMLQDHHAALWFVWPASFVDFELTPGGPVVLLALTNPMVWLATLPAVAWAAAVGVRGGDPRLRLLAGLFAATWLPFAVASRPIWLHSALSVVPFAFTAVSWGAVRLAARAARPARWLAAWAALVAATSLPLYLLATGRGTDLPLLRDLVERTRPPQDLERALQRPPGR